jgi:DNA-binding XRE family transcriptional regulator
MLGVLLNHCNFCLDLYITLLYIINMDGASLRTWRQKWGLSQAKLSKALGVSTMAVAYWEWGQRRIPPFLPLALEALEHRMKEEGKHGPAVGMPKVQKEE